MCFISVLAGIGLCRLESASSVLSCQVAHLDSLGRSNIFGVIEVCINEFPVLEVDKWAEEEEGVEDKGETPEWQPLDQPVGDEGRDESLW